MDIKLIVKALQLDDEQWEEHLDLIGKLRLLTDTERAQLATLGPVKKSTTKKPAGKGGGGKSKHASSLQQQIGNRDQSAIRPPAAAATTDDDGSSPRCQAKRGDNRLCMLLADHNIHHLPTAMDYHEFVAPPATHAATGD